SSIAISADAIGVLAAPANTATKPMPARRDGGSGRIPERAFPSVAPMKKRGVTSPPLKPAPRVTAVKISFTAKSQGYRCELNAARIVGMPRPEYRVVPISNVASATIAPPITGRAGAQAIYLLNQCAIACVV